MHLDTYISAETGTSHSAATGNNAIANKVIEDIQFLKDRIERIKKLQTPNSTVLRTYQSMLESRESVLEWLVENGDAEVTQADA